MFKNIAESFEIRVAPADDRMAKLESRYICLTEGSQQMIRDGLRVHIIDILYLANYLIVSEHFPSKALSISDISPEIETVVSATHHAFVDF